MASNAEMTEETNAERNDDGSIDDADEKRFSQEEVSEFDASKDGQKVRVGFLLLALFYMWPYQTMVQTQNYLTKKFPDKTDTVGNVMMNCTTWPFVVMHFFLTFTGFSRHLPYTCKIVVPGCAVVMITAYLIIVMTCVDGEQFLLYSLYGSAILFALVPQGVEEPAVMDMAGLFPSAFTSKNVMTGNGLCGVLVSTLNILTRLATHGLAPLTLQTEQQLTFVFFIIMALTGVGTCIVYLYVVRRSKYYNTYVKSEHDSAHQKSEEDGSSSGDGSQALGVRTGNAVCTAFDAAGYVWPSALALFITYITTLGLWPVLPGKTCLNDNPAEDLTLKDWWFDLVLFTFNLADFISKSEPNSLAWGADALSSKAHLGIAVLRALVFFPVMMTGSAPQSYDPNIARWCVLVAVFLLGISNGFLTTTIFMRGPKALPPDSSNELAEQVSTVLVIGLYIGIAGGCFFAYELGKHLPLGVCFGAP